MKIKQNTQPISQNFLIFGEMERMEDVGCWRVKWGRYEGNGRGEMSYTSCNKTQR